MRVTICALLVTFWLTPCAAYAQATPSPSPSPPAHESLGDAWWTGPMLAPSAGTLPRGHLLVEPYLYDVMQYGSYDSRSKLVSSTHSSTLGNLTYIIYGLADRLSVGMIPTANDESIAGGPHNSGVGIGDWSLLAQYRLTQYRAGSWIPTASIAVQETFPTGAYDRLSNPANGFGSGVYSTKVSLYTQTYAWMPNGRILRLRFNFSDTGSSGAAVSGMSVYGTSAGFIGSVKPGNTFAFDSAGEYSITQHWVIASDVVYGFTGNTYLFGPTGATNLNDSSSLAIAPAVEYNWNSNVGLLFGVRLYPAGHNTSASITPAFAFNYVH